MLVSDYLPRVAGTGLSWELQLNSVTFARVTYISEGEPLVQPLVAKCELLLDAPNTVYCTYRVARLVLLPKASDASGGSTSLP